MGDENAASGGRRDRRAFAPGPATSPSSSRIELLLHMVAVFALLYVFLVSIDLMGGAFKLFGKGFAENLIKGCSNPVVGLFIGILATSLIQSSSTTTSLTVGFVGGGVLPLGLAIPIIMGANIGTTITNILVSFGFVARKEDFRRAFAGATVHDFFNLCSVTLFFPIEMKYHVIQKLAERMTGAFDTSGGLRFTSPLKAIIKPASGACRHLFTDVLGLSPLPSGIILMTIASVALIVSLIFLVKLMRGIILQKAERAINKCLFRNDLTALVLGICLTAAAQSSSVTTSLMVPLVGAGVVTLARCYPYTLGANIGTTVTALLASLATVKAGDHGSVGVTAAFAHLIFNVLGIAVFYPLKMIPIYLARRLSSLAAESKRWAIVFVLGIFFALPLLMILPTTGRTTA